jgi:hypothetical protein
MITPSFMRHIGAVALALVSVASTRELVGQGATERGATTPAILAARAA